MTVSRAWIFPLAVFGFAAAGIAGFGMVFTSATRWLLLAGLILFLLSRARLLLAFRTPLAPALIAWTGWVLLTALWSDVPLLSLMKGVAIAATMVSLVSGGLYWARYARPTDPLSYLAPLAALALFAGLFGIGISRQINGGVVIFEGLSGNANAFGTLIAIALPWPLHAAYRARAHWPRMVAWIAVALLLLTLLVLTKSRASAVIALCTLLGFALAALPRKTLAIGALAGLVLVGAVAVFPPLTHRIVAPALHLLGKGNDDLLVSRRELWRRSYDYAARGGVVGMGYGVSAESHLDFAGGTSTAGYGREKGNSQLAIVEETGLIGLAIYAVLLLQLFHFLISRTIAARRETRIAAGLLTGALAGVVLQSVFEAWWTAPGSLQSIFFWSTAGAAIGILRRPRSALFSLGAAMTEQPAGDTDTDEIDLSVVLAALRRRWWVVLGCTVAALLVCAVQLRGAPPLYQVAMTVGAVEHSAYDARRAMPGVRVETRDAAARQTSTNAMEFALYVESLQGRGVADALAKNPEALNLAGGGDGAQVHRFLLHNLMVGQDQKKHAFATISLQSAQPERAVRLLALLHQATDDLLRQNALVRSRQMIAGLNALPNPDAATIEALGEQHVTEAAALSQAPFAAQLVGPPAALPDPIGSPFRTLAGALFLGLAGGAALALSLEWLGAWRAKRVRPQ